MKRNEATVACPRLIAESPCEAALRVALGGRREDAWIDEYDAACGHVLTDVEEGLVLDAAIEELGAREQDRADYFDHYWR